MEKSSLISELTQGKEFTQQLMNHLNPASSSLQTRLFLIEKVLSSYEKALSLLNLGANFHVQSPPSVSVSESMKPIPNTTSPTSDISDHDTKDLAQQNVSRKRKTQQRWTKRVKVGSEIGAEGSLEDGCNWRKYGQKDILGAHFPRAYYRCTHRHSQGCLAIRQVQRSDEDPSIFEVTYRGRHTCVQASRSSIASVSIDNSEQNQYHPQRQQKKPRFEQTTTPTAAEVFLNLEQGFRVKTENLDTGDEVFPSFSILDTWIDKQTDENNLVGNLTPAYFSTSSCKFDNFGAGYNVRTPESELTELGSIPTSVTNSPIGEFDFSNLDFETSFQFDNLEFDFLA